MTTETLTARKGSSLARFLSTATKQQWEVETQQGEYRQVTVTATTQPEDGRTHKVQASFTEEGNFSYGAAWGTRNGTERKNTRDARIGELLDLLHQGPKARAEAKARKKAEAEAEAERKEKAQAALALAADTEEVRQLKWNIAHDLHRAERKLTDALDTLASRIERAKDAVKEGQQTDRFGGGPLHNQALAEVQEAAATRNALLEQKWRIEAMFGPMEKVSW